MPDQDPNNEPARPNLRFTVMPDLEGIGKIPVSPPPIAPVSPPSPIPAAPEKRPVPPSVKPLAANPETHMASPAPAGGLTDQLRERRGQMVAGGGPSRVRKVVVVLLIVIIVLALTGIVGAFLWKNYRSQSGAADNTAPANEQAEEKEEGAESPVASETAKDTDGDGLSDVEEQERGTDLNDPDTDGDGLADGDEVKIFNTSAFSPHSDDDGYSDSAEIKDGYAPLISGDAKLTDLEIQKIGEALSSGKMHQPTIETIGGGLLWKDKINTNGSQNNPAASSGSQFAYQDATYNYQIILPGGWKKTEASKENITFIEKDSKLARYVQVQVVTTANLLESEIKRAGQAVTGDVRYRESRVAGTTAYKLSYDFERQPSTPEGAVLKSSIIEYLVLRTNGNFIITIGCTADGGSSCLTSVEQLAAAIEKDARF